MYRMKLSHENGSVFLSPFVYSLSPERMKKKVKKLDWVTKHGRTRVATLDFFEVDGYPIDAVWIEGVHDVVTLDELKARIVIAENSWKLKRGWIKGGDEEDD